MRSLVLSAALLVTAYSRKDVAATDCTAPAKGSKW